MWIRDRWHCVRKRWQLACKFLARTYSDTAVFFEEHIIWNYTSVDPKQLKQIQTETCDLVKYTCRKVWIVFPRPRGRRDHNQSLRRPRQPTPRRPGCIKNPNSKLFGEKLMSESKSLVPRSSWLKIPNCMQTCANHTHSYLIFIYTCTLFLLHKVNVTRIGEHQHIFVGSTDDFTKRAGF